MPTYDFGCMTCEQTVSISQPIDQDIRTPICAKCGYRMIRSFGVGTIKFAGDGWASKEK